MQMRTVLIVAAGVAVLGTGAAVWLSSFGRATYRPGAVANAVANGRIDPAPAGALVEHPAGADGTVPFSLEVPGGVTLWGFSRGRGSPVLVVHGGPGFPFDAPLPGLAPLEDRHKFYYWDQRGSGRSTRPVDRFASPNFGANAAELDSKLGLGQQVADLERLRVALGADRIDLVGHSFGGLLAGLYAIEFPQHVGKLLLVAPAPLVVFPPASGGLYAEIRRDLPAAEHASYDRWLKDFLDYGRLFRRTEAELAKLNAAMVPFYEMAATSRGTPRQAIGRTDPARIGGWAMHAVFLSMGRKHDWSAAFASIRAPTLLLYGGGDLTEAGSFDQYRAIPGIQLVEIAGADHFALYDPVRFPAAGLSFLD